MNNSDERWKVSYDANALNRLIEKENVKKAAIMRCVHHTSYMSIDKWISGQTDMPVNAIVKICNTFGARLLFNFLKVEKDGVVLELDETADTLVVKEKSADEETSTSSPDEAKYKIIKAQETIIEQQQELIRQLQQQLRISNSRKGEEPMRYGLVCDDSGIDDNPTKS